MPGKCCNPAPANVGPATDIHVSSPAPPESSVTSPPKLSHPHTHTCRHLLLRPTTLIHMPISIHAPIPIPVPISNPIPTPSPSHPIRIHIPPRPIRTYRWLRLCAGRRRPLTGLRLKPPVGFPGHVWRRLGNSQPHEHRRIRRLCCGLRPMHPCLHDRTPSLLLASCLHRGLLSRRSSIAWNHGNSNMYLPSLALAKMQVVRARNTPSNRCMLEAYGGLSLTPAPVQRKWAKEEIATISTLQ